jgi:hypothetical protein
VTRTTTEPTPTRALATSDRFWWILLLISLAGPIVFGLGYANLGIRIAGLPIPLADVLLVALLARALVPVITGHEPLPDLPFLCALGLAAIGLIRLAVDYGTYGVDAARDVVLPLELTFLLVGSWAMRRFGLERWIRALTWIFLAAIAYFLIVRLFDPGGPIVGFTQPRPLFEPSWGVEIASTAGFAFFLWVRPVRRWSYLIALGFVALAFLSQKRGIYLALPIATVVCVAVAWHRLDRSARRGLLVLGGASVIVVALLLALAPAGRLGRFTPSLFFDQLRTLVGYEGEGSGTISDRAHWASGVIDQMNERPASYLVGLGLGPDLLRGFVDLRGLPVRKPHDDYLEVMARLGIPALLLMLGALVLPLVTIGRAARRRDGPERGYLLFALGASMAAMLVAATQPLLFYPFGTIPLAFYLGSGYVVAREGSPTPG